MLTLDRLERLISAVHVLKDYAMFDYREADLDRYGPRIYHHFRKQGNHRWDTTVHKNSDGQFVVIFRHSYSKKQADGVKRSMIRDESIVRANDENELYNADFPKFQDADIFKDSDFFKSLNV